ncbi:MAG: adenylyltransferase/cytidyltransferase family protein [Candidatus Pacearchaeota archaeon]|nr:adenylyltransferase/cytidyltransferase family protein [Candidatus Pacearchaeota archaeon]
MNKIKTREEIKKIAERLRQEGKIIVTTNGSFDIMHYAHVNLLEKAKNEGDVLIVLLNSDSSIKRQKGETRPIIPENERARMLEALESVDYVVIFAEDKPLDLLREIKPNKHIKGGSFILERIKEEKDLLESWGGEFKNFELEEGFSTTNIIEKILENGK